jgi:signal transduction histidine kinase
MANRTRVRHTDDVGGSSAGAAAQRTTGGGALSEALPWLMLLAAVIFSVLAQWPNLHSFSAATALVVCLATAAFAFAGVLLWKEGGQRPNAILFVCAAFFFCLDWSYTWPGTPLTFLGVWLGQMYAVVVATILLRYPSNRLARIYERRFILAVAGWIILGKLAYIVTARPEWVVATTGHGHVSLAADTWWPTWYADRSLSQGLFLVNIGGLLLATIAFVGLFAHRFLLESTILRDELLPAFVGSLLLTAVVATHLISLLAFPEPSLATEVRFGTAEGAVVMLIPVLFIVAAIRSRLARAAVADLVVRLAPPVSSGEVRAALREALGDPSLEILYWVGETATFVNADGLPAESTDGVGRMVVPVKDSSGDPLATVYADPAFERHRSLLTSAVAAIAMAVANSRLEAAVRAQLEEVRASRSRIVEAGLIERRRMERDLHDGAQQRLLALGASIGRLELHAETPGTRAVVGELRMELSSARQELRDLAHGLHPAVLTHAGLGPAVETIAERLPLGVEVSIPAERWDPNVEGTAYFVVCEALTNVAKHSGAHRARVAVLARDTELSMKITDDGSGTAAFVDGGGLSGLRDRVRALGGDMSLRSAPGQGTEISVRLPCG